MTLELLISTYGYPALLLGTFLEGETILIIAGFLAHRGYLTLPWVIAVAFLGTFSGDHLYFWIGRTRGSAFLRRWPSWQSGVERVYRLLEKYHTLLILGFRFYYGLRMITTFAIGTSRFDPKKFIILNAVGGLVWAIVVGAGGYVFGQALEIVIGDIKHCEIHILMAMVIIGLILLLIHLYRRRAS